MSWPKMCVRCGETTPEKLKQSKFRWSQLLFQTQQQNTTYNHSVYVDVTIFLCEKCRRIALIRLWLSLLLSLAGLGIGFSWTFGAFGNVDLLGLIVLFPATFFFVFLILLRRHVARFYAHFYHSSGYIRGFFRSKTYKEAFDHAFPGGIYINK